MPNRRILRSVRRGRRQPVFAEGKRSVFTSLDATDRATIEPKTEVSLDGTTGRQNLERALEESEARFRTYLDSAPDGIFVVDPAGRYLFANPSACRLTGYTASELKAMRTEELVPEADRAQVLGRMERMHKTGSISEEMVYRRKNGSQFHALLEGTALPDGNCIGFMKDITARKQAERALADSEGRVRAKLDAILSPQGDLGALQLEDVLNVPEIQALMNDFCSLTGIGVGIVDTNGKVLVKTGWQEVCTHFHRINPATNHNCLESDLVLSSGVPAGTFKMYKCKNNLWDIATPIVVGEQRLGNLFLGQFFFDDESPVEEVFRNQARHHGFNETDYLAAVHRIPRLSHARVDAAMRFYMRFSTMVSALSWSNVRLARTLAERERAQEALVASEAYFRTLSESSFEGIVMTERAVFRDCNTQFAALVGSTRQSLLGRDMLDFIAPESRETVRAAISNEDPGPYFGVAQAVDGTRIDVELRARMVNVGEHRIRVTAVRDIRHLKAAEAERIELERRLLHAQKLESLGVLAGGIAHDFNNLLTVIMGNLSLAQDELPATSDLRMLVDQALKSSRHARNLTRQMLAYSGRGAFLVQPVDLNTLVEENARLFRSAVPRTIDLLLSLAPQPAVIQADQGQIQQVVMNLITNAAEAIAASGTIRLATRIAFCSAPELDKSRLPDKPAPGVFVWIEVTDDGCGMDDSTREKLFDPFFTTKFAGRGLGMAAVLGIVRGHHGAVFVTSHPDRGTLIQVLFPSVDQTLAASPAASPRDSATLTTPALSLPGVLLIDDESSVLRVGRAMLERFGHPVFSADSGDAGRRILENHCASIGIAIVDLSMPVKDGIATLQELRAINPELPVILCSGFAEEELRGRLEGMPLVKFLQKPYERAQVRMLVTTLLEAAGASKP